MTKNVIYIYNLHQINFLLANEVYPLEVGLGNRKNDVYLLFPRNEKTNEVLTRWKERMNP